MARNGSGVFSLPEAAFVFNTVIDEAAMNNNLNQIATALTESIARDGQTTISANIPMNSKKFTGLAVGTNNGDSVTLGQAQDAGYVLIGSVAGTDTITGGMSPGITAYAAGQKFCFIAAGANTGATTINIDSVGAKSVTKLGATALAANDILSGMVCKVIYDGTQFQLQNPAINLAAPVAIGSGTPAAGTFTTLTANTSLVVNGSSAMTGILDQDDMSSDSNVSLATQQSIKAYIDNEITANAANLTTALLEAGDVTTTSTTFVSSSQSITATLRSGMQHLVTFTFAGSTNTGSSQFDFDIFDGTNYASSGTSTPETNGIASVDVASSNDQTMITVQGRFTGLSSGSTTFTLYWKSQNAAHIATIKANSVGPKVVASILEAIA